MGTGVSTTLKDVNLNRIVVFVAVVESGSLTAAAERLGLAKTMVSKHLQRLEAELGASLLARTTRKLSLTEAGEAFYEASRVLIRDAETAVLAAGRNTTELRGTLRVTAPVDVGVNVIAPLMVGLRRRHPGLEIELLTGDRLFDLVGEGIDVAIRLGNLADSNLQAVRIATFTHWLVCHPDLAPKLPNTPDEVARWPFVGLSVLLHPLTWRFQGPRNTVRTIQFEAPIMANTAHVVHATAVAGGGLVILPHFAVAQDVAAARLVRLLPKWRLPDGGVHAVFPATRYRPQKVRVFIDALTEQFARAPCGKVDTSPSGT
jgi:DNA-binding transcriptional LysR family regulator